MSFKSFYSFPLLLTLFQISLSQGLASDRPTVHGMLVFGEETLFLSHLPMFHAPHDYQGIWEVKIKPSEMTHYLKDRKDHPSENIYTLEPEAFVLPDLAAQRKPFKGVLFRGHFERGGVPIASGVSVTPVKTLFFKKLTAAAPHLKSLGYAGFGKGKEAFLVHLIQGKPSFDQVLAVNLESLNTPLNLNPRAVIIKTQSDDKPLAEKTEIQVEVENEPKPTKLSVSRQFYLEFADLAD